MQIGVEMGVPSRCELRKPLVAAVYAMVGPTRLPDCRKAAPSRTVENWPPGRPPPRRASVRPLLDRRKIAKPSSFSRLFMEPLRVGWVINRLAAARVMDLLSATAMKLQLFQARLSPPSWHTGESADCYNCIIITGALKEGGGEIRRKKREDGAAVFPFQPQSPDCRLSWPAARW